MFAQILKPVEEEKDEDGENIENTSFTNIPSDGMAKKKGVIKKKIKFITKMLKMQKILREENENILSIKAINNDKLPQGLLLEGKAAIEEFKRIKYLDLQNEKRPY